MVQRVAAVLLFVLLIPFPSSADDLVAAMLQLKSQQEVDAFLVAHEKELSPAIPKELIAHANEQRDQLNYTDAISTYEIAVKVAQQIKQDSAIADAWNEMASAYESMGKQDEELKYAQQSLQLSQKAKYDPGIAAAQVHIGNVQETRGKYPEALASLQQCFSIYEKLQDNAGMGMCANTIGLVYNDQAKYDESDKWLQKALTLRKQIGDKRMIATTLNDIGINFFSQGRYSEGVPYMKQALEEFQAIGDKKWSAVLMFNLGAVYENWGDLRTALNNFQEAIRVTEELPTQRNLNYMLFGVGVIYKKMGNYQEALRYHQRGLSLSQKAGDQRGIADGFCHIGAVYSELGNYSLAANYTKKCLEVRQEANLKDNLPDALGDLGKIYLREGNEDVALKYFEEGLQMSQQLNQQQNIPQILNMRGYAHFLAGNPQLAATDYDGALQKADSLKDKFSAASTLRNLGYLYFSEKDFQKASDSFEKSLALWKEMESKSQIADALLGLANVSYALGQFQKALQYSNSSIELADKTHSPDLEWQGLATLGKSQRALNQDIDARKSFDRAIEIVDTLRLQVAGSEEERQKFFEDKVEPYEEMVSLLYQQHKSSEAFLYAERAKARVLDDVLENGRIEITKALSENERKQQETLVQNLVILNTQIRNESTKTQPDSKLLSDLQQQLEKARLEYEAFHATLYNAHPELKMEQAKTEPPGLDEFGQFLGPQDVYLEYVATEKEIFLFLIKQENHQAQLTIYPIERKRTEIAEQIDKLHAQLSQRDPDFLKLAQDLYRELISPGEAELSMNAHLIIIPDRELWGLPFQALVNSQGSYLIQRYAVSYAPSITVLRDIAKRSRSTGGENKLLAFANPAIASSVFQRAQLVYLDQTLQSLPETETEVKLLQKLFGPDSAKIYTGEAASEATLKRESSGYAILHLATHGILDSSSPMYSHVILSHPQSESTEDGLLEAWEIMQMNLSADLVVLSACETALGRIGAGEGMIGLSWAFFMAGSKATVVSQWKVESQSTEELMLGFYKNLRKGNSKAEALRQAALALSGNPKFHHPFYWAGFVLVGKS